MFHLLLVLSEARHDELRELMDRLAGASIAIVTLGDFAARARDARRSYLDVIEAAREGWPESDPDLPGDARTVVDWNAIIGEAPEAIVAEQRGRLVGFTSAIGTGVRPQLRGRGIATALKVAWIDAALARGEMTLTTATGHPAMRHVNEKLGYRETACEVRMVLRLV
ncbi:MAG: GNAT family N-acetyltransferase [Deltaproteobacteria bacterium]|nr:GNAT family N-acetyltransferase [Deltaproteobacteria bacterium]